MAGKAWGADPVRQPAVSALQAKTCCRGRPPRHLGASVGAFGGAPARGAGRPWRIRPTDQSRVRSVGTAEHATDDDVV